MRKVLTLALFAFCCQFLQGQEGFRFQLNNGLTLYLIPDSTADNYFVSLSVLGGSLFDRCNETGTAKVLENLPLSGSLIYPGMANFENLKRSIFPDFQSETLPEQFRYFGHTGDLGIGITFLKELVLFPSLDDAALKMAVAKSNQYFAKKSIKNPDYQIDERILSELYSQSPCPIQRFPAAPLSDTLFDLDSLSTIYKKNMTPDRSLLIIKGPVDLIKTQVDLGRMLEDWQSPPSESALTIREKLYKTNILINQDQDLVFRNNDENVFKLVLQAPSFQNDYGMLIPSLIYEEMLLDPQNTEAEIFNKYPFSMDMETYKFHGKLEITWKISDSDLFDFLSRKDEILKALWNPSIVSNQQFQDKRKIVKDEFQKELSESESFEMISKYWSTSTIAYMQSFLEIADEVTVDDIKKFQYKYLENAFGYELLIIDSAKYFSNTLDTVYLPFSEDLFDYAIFFPENSANLVPTQYKKLLEIKQFLTANPHYQVQVNGFADKREYLKIKDSKLDSLIASFPTFKRVEEDVFNKKYTRLDFARSLYVIKFFLDSGINSKRILGTASLNKAPEKEMMINNQKCSFSWNIIRSERFMKVIGEAPQEN